MFRIDFNATTVASCKSVTALCNKVKELLYSTSYGQKFVITVMDTINNCASFSITSFRGDCLFIDNLSGTIATFYEDDKWYFWDENKDLIISSTNFKDCLVYLLTRV